MTTVLKITSSLHGGDGQSSRLAALLVDALARRTPGLQVIERDLSRQPPPHLDAERFGAFITAPALRTAAQREAAAMSDTLIDELRQADLIVLGLPMYNFGVPSPLKAWIDHVARAGVTFKYTDQGSIGLLTGKKAFVLATRGGVYGGAAAETQTTYVRDFLRFIGIDDVEFVHAEGLALGTDAREASLAKARLRVQNLAAPIRRAA